MSENIFNRKTAIGLGIIMTLYVIIKIVSPLYFPYYIQKVDPSLYNVALKYETWLKTLFNAFIKGTDIAVGIFLVFEAKRAEYNRLLWFGLGAVFGLISLILFYIYRIYENTNPKKINE
jgi:hypothetical protein